MIAWNSVSTSLYKLPQTRATITSVSSLVCVIPNLGSVYIDILYLGISQFQWGESWIIVVEPCKNLEAPAAQTTRERLIRLLLDFGRVVRSSSK